MQNRTAGFAHSLLFTFTQVDAMGKQAAIGQKAERVVNVSVVFRTWEQLFHQGDFAGTF